MDILFREATGKSRGLKTFRDSVLSGDSFGLGSAPDQEIQLVGPEVKGEHAVLKPSRGGLSVQCRRGAEVLVNGERKRSANLAPGDVLEVAGHTLTLIDAPSGFDLALQYEPNPNVDNSAYETAFSTDLDQTWLSRRAPSWVLLVLVAVVTLGVPLGYVLWLEPEARRDVAEFPPDALWTSGPLHPAHELAMGNDCSACHTDLFQRVADADCRVCHDALIDHVHGPRAVELGLEFDRCATCHREHNEPEHLVIQADGQCTDCHASPDMFARPLMVDAVNGFSETTHPEFKPRLLEPVITDAGTGLSFSWRHRVDSLEGAREQSNLVFPHDIHLDEVKVRHPNEGRALACGDCHQLTEDREHFRPIEMETDCASCHELTFDVTAPDRQLPHGEPREVAFAIEGYFARKFLDPDSAEDAAPRRRRPDRSDAGQVCDASPQVCVEQRTVAEVTNQFTVRGCVTCHEVSANDASDVYSRFQVHPVRLTPDYFESARFDHASHFTQEGKTGDAACLSCHPADTSSVSADLLMPGIDNCTACHGDPSVPDVVALQCIACHEFHPSAFSAGRDLEVAAGGSVR